MKTFEESVDPDVPDPNLPESEAAKIAEGDMGEKQKRAKAKNFVAMASLTLALSDPEDIAALHDARTTKWPKGLACLVVK